MEIVVAASPFVTFYEGRGQGEQSPMAQAGTSCSRVACTEPVVTSLGREGFCFDHFCRRCYELLEHADRGIGSERGTAGLAGSVCALEECARRALEISFREAALKNLDRARLLDIVLWSGDLTTLLRRKLHGAARGTERQESCGEWARGQVRNGRPY